MPSEPPFFGALALGLKLRIEAYDLPLARPYHWAKGTQHRRLGFWVHVRREDGFTGCGEVAPPPHESELEALGSALAAFEGSHTLSSLQPALTASTLNPRLRCGLSTALLQAEAAARHIPLRELLAPGSLTRHEVAVNALVTAPTASGAAEEAVALWQKGFTTLKVKCSPNAPHEHRRTAAIRDAVPTATLRLDANEAWGGWTPAQLRALSELRADYVEQPLPQSAPRVAQQRAKSSLPARLFIDEGATSLAAILQLYAEDCADGCILKPQRLGGLDRCAALMRRLEAEGIPYTLTNSLETAVGLHATTELAATNPRCRSEASGLATAAFFAAHPCAPPHISNGLAILNRES